MIWPHNIHTFVLIFSLFPLCCQCGEISGEIYAFIDVNYDRFTDLIVKRKNNIVVYKSITNEKDLKFTEKLDFVEDRDYTQDFSNYGEIENIAVADFNGDSFPDLLVTTREAGSTDQYFASVCWGTLTTFNPCDYKKFTFKEQPLIMNCDDDSLSDIFGITSNNSRVCYLGQSSMHAFSFTPMPSITGLNRTVVPGAAHGFVDMTGDLNADLILEVIDPSKELGKSLPQFEVWSRNGPEVSWTLLAEFQIPAPPMEYLLVRNGSTSPPLFPLSKENWFTTGHVIFDDFNRDGSPDLLMPLCIGPKLAPCQNFRLAIWSGEHRRWFLVTVNNMPGTAGILFTHIEPGSFVATALTVRSGDYTQNGYPDLLIVMTGGKKDTTYPYFITNVPCSSDPGKPVPLDCDGFGRTFQLGIQPVASCSRVTAAAFFDLKEDGSLDVLFDCVNETLGAGGRHSVQFAASKSDQDSTFLKVEAYTAACGASCPNDKEGTGISLPGATFLYRMQDTDGSDISATSTQQSRTSHRSLQLPYALFGLGRTPNFVDKLTLGVPQWPASTQSWPQMVPNSRMYVIPYPAKDPSHWVGRLYVTPNRLVLMSVAALGGVCLLIGMTVVVLHCCEMRQDKKERDVMKKRFHFDAM